MMHTYRGIDPSSRLRRFAPVAAALVAACCWGASWPLTRLVARDVAPLEVAALGAGASTLVLAVALGARALVVGRRGGAFARAGGFRSLGIGIVEPALASVCFYAGLALTSASIASLIDALQSFVSAILALVFLRERAGWMLWPALGVATIGVTLAAFEPSRAEGSLAASFAGDALVLGGTLAASTYSILIKRFTPHVDPLGATALQTSAALALLAPVAVGAHVAKLAPFATLDMHRASTIAAVGIVANAVPFLLFTYALRSLSASVASFSLLLVPIVATLASGPLLHEFPSRSQAAGIALALAALVAFAASQGARKDSPSEVLRDVAR